MSIKDGIVVLANENVQSRKNKNNKKDKGNYKKKDYRNDSQSQNQRKFSGNNYNYNYSKSSYLYSDEDGEREDTPKKNPENDKRAREIYNFCEEFISNTDNFKTLQSIVIEDFPDIIPYMKKYYDGRNSDMFQDALNKLLKLMCTSQFANTLNSVLNSKIWIDDGVFGDIWDSIGFGLSLALDTNHKRMHIDVNRLYATKILPRLYNPEIEEIRLTTGVTGDLALDLMISLPVPMNEWNGSTLDAFYSRFLDMMLIHAEDNMDILNWETQGMLYERFFGKSKTALKVIGKFLTSEPIAESESVVANAVYQEFLKMLYKKLDKYDIDDIEYVLNFVSKKRQEFPDKDIIFNSIKASEYDNIRTGMISLMDKIPETKKYLA